MWEAISLTLEYYNDEQAGQGIGLVCHYQPVRHALFRVGMVNRQFLVSGGWRFGQCWIELGLGWQAALGLQQQLQVSIDWEKRCDEVGTDVFVYACLLCSVFAGS